MPDYPILSGADIIKALERLGFEGVRSRGSHVVMQRGGSGCVVPLHKEVKRGTLESIVRQSGIDAEAFIAALSDKS